jgi:type I restriction enzyme, R subunit
LQLIAQLVEQGYEVKTMNEDQLEQLCLDWFRDIGWDFTYGPDLAPDSSHPARADYREVVLKHELRSAISTLNPQLPESAIDQAISIITKPASLDLRVGNRTFHSLLLNGVPVEYRQKDSDETTPDVAFLIDFDRFTANQFLVVNQFTIQGTKQTRRPDVVCFINGLPIAILELKSPNDTTADIWKAYSQLQTYKDEAPDLFVFNEALVVSDGYTARVGSLTATSERFMPWRTLKHEDDKPLLEWQLETLIKGFFDRELLLDYLRFFVLFEADGEQITKKIAGYHQFHAVRAAVKATILAAQAPVTSRTGERRATYGDEVLPGSKKAGVVWHTQGSGKSISMCCYAGKLLQQSAMSNPTLVVVTDRNDLDGQLFQTFCNAQELFKQTPVQANDRDELRQMLSAKETGGIIFTTIQKFKLNVDESVHPRLSKRHNIVVITDEAHRSQYGIKAKLNEKTGEYQYGYAKHLRDAIPNATFIGFTGTPVSSDDKDTRAVFGDYVSVYDIQDAVDDGATVPIYYESRLAKLDLNHAEIEALSQQAEEVVEEDEDLATREKTKSTWSQLEKLVGTAPRLEQVAQDLVTHFEERTAIMDGKAMIVAMSREICVNLYDAIIALRPEWHHPDPDQGAIKIVMTGSASDRTLLQPHIYNKQTKKRLEKRFKNPQNSLRLVIVRDMWLTGFDAPCCHTMYIDKPMKSHNLMQAIARVNRVFKDKPGGLVVDYIGIASELKQALKTYTESKGRGEPALRAEEAFSILLERLDVARGMFAASPNSPSFDYSTYETNATRLLVPAANHILGLEDGKKRFLDTVLAITKAYSLCGTLDEAQALRIEIAFFSAIKVAITKATTVDHKLTQEAQNSALKQILDNAILAEGMIDVFALAGLNKPDIALLSDAFLEEVRQMPYRNLAVELLEKLLNDNIKSKTRNNVIQEKKFADRLQEALRKYNNRSIETAQVIEELIQMAKDFQAALQREESLGLHPDEVAFYDALANNESAVRELGDEILKKIAIEITEKLRRSTTVDWQVRESVRARLRILVRRTLQRYKYPPDKASDAIELVLKQAEVLSQNWSH